MIKHFCNQCGEELTLQDWIEVSGYHIEGHTFQCDIRFCSNDCLSKYLNKHHRMG